MGSLPRAGLDDRLAGILAICRKMNSQRELGPLLDVIAREAGSLLDCDRASIFLLDRDGKEVWSKIAPGSDDIVRSDAALGIAGRAVTTGETVNLRDISSDSPFDS